MSALHHQFTKLPYGVDYKTQAQFNEGKDLIMRVFATPSPLATSSCGTTQPTPILCSQCLSPPGIVLVAKATKEDPAVSPGPKGYPSIGNPLNFPVGLPLWEGLAKLTEQRGEVGPVPRASRTKTMTAGTDVPHLRFPGTEVVVLNSSKVISDLLDKHSAIHSDGVRMPRRTPSLCN